MSVSVCVFVCLYECVGDGSVLWECGNIDCFLLTSHTVVATFIHMFPHSCLVVVVVVFLTQMIV